MSGQEISAPPHPNNSISTLFDYGRYHVLLTSISELVHHGQSWNWKAGCVSLLAIDIEESSLADFFPCCWCSCSHHHSYVMWLPAPPVFLVTQVDNQSSATSYQCMISWLCSITRTFISFDVAPKPQASFSIIIIILSCHMPLSHAFSCTLSLSTSHLQCFIAHPTCEDQRWEYCWGCCVIIAGSGLIKVCKRAITSLLPTFRHVQCHSSPPPRAGWQLIAKLWGDLWWYVLDSWLWPSWQGQEQGGGWGCTCT